MSESFDRSAARARSYLNVISDIFYSTYENQHPLDNTLRSFFRENKKYGSKDRRFITESLYAVYRWFGWLKDDFPSQTNSPEESSEFCSSLLNALAWDETFQDHPVVAYLIQKFSFEPKTEMDDSLLAPDWLQDECKEIDYRSLQSRPPVWIRLQGQNKDKALTELENKGAGPEVLSELTGAVKLNGSRLNLSEFISYKKGSFEIQDLASQCLGVLCAPNKGEFWWDVCAGGGGKSLQLASLLENSGKVTSSDIRTFKLKEVMKRAQRGRFENIQTKTVEQARNKKYEGVLIDAPCSCTGVWRRNPESRWMTSKRDVEEIAKIQKQILEESCHAVKAGGKLVYATCSITQTENEAVVENFLELHPEFKLNPIKHPLTNELTDGMIRINFQPHDSDAMFAAVMIRL